MKLNKKTIYRVKTQELFDKMMEDAKKQGYTTLPSIAWHTNQEKTAVRIDMDGVLGFARIGYYQENDDYDTYDFTEYRDIPEIYPINFGCVGVDAPDFETAFSVFKNYLNNREGLINMLNEKVYTIRVQGDNTTVITPDGKVATAKCHPDDEFDIVEGFRVALEKIKDSERKLTDDERAILNIFLTAGCTTLLVDKYLEMTGKLKDKDICTINVRMDSGSIYSEDVFEWLDDGEEYNIQELMKKYA